MRSVTKYFEKVCVRNFYWKNKRGKMLPIVKKSKKIVSNIKLNVLEKIRVGKSFNLVAKKKRDIIIQCKKKENYMDYKGSREKQFQKNFDE